LLQYVKNLRMPEILLFIVAAVVPVIVRVVSVPIPPELVDYTRGAHATDLFSYHKAWLLCFCAVLIVLHGVSELLIKPPGTEKMKAVCAGLVRDPIVILTAVYLFFVIISTLFSPYLHTSLWGIHDRREGLFVQLAYMTVFLAALFYAKAGGLHVVRIILAGLMISSIIMGAIGFSQFINRDFFHTALASWLVQGHFVRYGLTPVFEMAYGTNFNPNTFGKVTAMLFPLMFAAATVFEHKVWKGLFVLAGLLMFIGVVASRSVGGLIGAAAAVSAVTIVLIVRRGVSRRFFIALGAALAVIAAGGALMWNFVYNDLIFTLGRVAAIFEPPQTDYADFDFDGRSVTLTDRGVSYTITFPETPGVPELVSGGVVIEPAIFDITPEPEPGEDRATLSVFRYIYEVPGFGAVEIVRQAMGYAYRGLLLTVDDGILKIICFFTSDFVDPSVYIPSWGFQGWETWGSNRGYIFARSFPLVMQSLLIGSGPDTFILRFPQHDIISKLQFFQNPWTMVDKAHNLYLQTAITTGLVSAIALIGIFAVYLVSTFWALVRGAEEYFWLRLAILGSVSAYSVASLATDSTVSSTPMFWLIIGVGFAVNRMFEVSDNV